MRDCSYFADSCISKGCHNDGTCTSIGMKWKCICKPGYDGEYCQHGTTFIDFNVYDQIPESYVNLFKYLSTSDLKYTDYTSHIFKLQFKNLQ